MSFNVTFDLDPLASNSSPQDVHCGFSSTGVLSFTCFTIANTFLLPLYLLVLYKGVQQRCRPGETSAGHSNLVTYNLVVLEMLNVFGLIVYSCGINTGALIPKRLGIHVFTLLFPGQTLSHTLACVEHYLAVVHPTTYRRLRKSSGLRMRWISCGCVWVLCLLLNLMEMLPYVYTRYLLFNLVLYMSIACVFGCYISILRVLKSPRPGDRVKEREVVDRPKQKASNIIKAILAVQVLRTTGFFLSFTLSKIMIMPREVCLVMNFGLWLMLPGSVVLPLLFLHRAGNFNFCRHKN